MRPRKSYGITPLYIINVVILLTGVVLCIGGTWASISVIKQQLAREELSQPFSCADNSSI